MNPIMNLYQVVASYDGFDDEDFFIVYEVDPETGIAVDIQNVIYPMQ